MSTARTSGFDEEVDLDALQRIDPRLVALALGRIDEDELEELLVRALREPDIRRAVEAFWPLDDEARQRSFEQAERALAAYETVPQRPHWSLMFLPTGVAAAVITGVTVLATSIFQSPALPDYRLEVSGGLRQVRSAQTNVLLGQLTPEAPIELIFRPKAEVQGPATAAMFRVEATDLARINLVRIDREPDVSPTGSVRWRGSVGALLPGEHGAVELLLAVRSGHNVPTVEEVRRGLRQPKPTLRIAKTTLVIDTP